jgi:lysyl-tRNA synthetase class I
MEDYSENLYLYLDGLEVLAREASGDENVHIGIRPYGFHAGNALALVAYPYVLCETYRQYHNREPRFHFFISINDWEQDALDGPDYRKYPFNIYPKSTSIQHTSYRMQDGHECPSTDYWQPIIESAVRSKLGEFGSVALLFVRNSGLRDEITFRDFLEKTINHPIEQSRIFQEFSGKELLEEPISYAGVICPECHRAHGKTSIENKPGRAISWQCADCRHTARGLFQEFDFWWYHKPLLVARLKIFDIDITLSGGDHFSEGDYMIRKEMIKYFDPSIKVPKMIFTPTLLSPIDGERMSKSRGNHVFANPDDLIDIARTCRIDKVMLPQDLVMNVNDEQYKSHCCRG